MTGIVLHVRLPLEYALKCFLIDHKRLHSRGRVQKYMREFEGIRCVETALVDQFQRKIQKYTRKVVKQFDDGDLGRNIKRFEILDKMRRNGKYGSRGRSKVLKQAVERCLRRIINSLLAPYLGHCRAFKYAKDIEDEFIALIKNRENVKRRKMKCIGSGNGMHSQWPCLFLVMVLEWIPIIYQFLKYDLTPNNDKLNVQRLNTKIERYGLTLKDEDSEYLCNRLTLSTKLLLVD